MARSFIDISLIYAGSDGQATLALYADLEKLGPVGKVAMNLFRACKTSERAKQYRGGDGRGSFRSKAYGRKDYSITNLCELLTKEAAALKIDWGWAKDPQRDVHDQILYVDIPTGQVSFHAAARYEGHDYSKPWDGSRGVAADRICRWVAKLFSEADEQ